MNKYQLPKFAGLLLLLCAAASGSADAQLRSAQWLERMPYRYQLNPALLNDFGYFAMPVLGSFNLNVQSNVGLSTFLYPHPSSGKLVTFLNQAYPTGEFMSKISDVSTLKFDVSMPILSFGFFGFGGYNTFGVDSKVDVGVEIPKGLFAFLKQGMASPEGSGYDISNLTLNANVYSSVGIGHAHPINDKLTMGITLKALLGLANIRGGISDFGVTFGPQELSARLNADLSASVLNGNIFATDAAGKVSGIDLNFSNAGLSGLGFSADVGATYQLFRKLKMTLALTDLGFIKWSNSAHAYTKNSTFTFSGFTGIGGEQSFSDQIDSIAGQLTGLIDLYGGEPQATTTTTYLNAVLRAGMELDVVSNKITLGLLSTTRFAGSATWTELMGSLNLKPFGWLQMAATGSLSNFGPSWGWVVSWAPRYFLNIFVGADYMPLKVTPQLIPVDNLLLNLNVGVNIPLNRNKLKNRMQPPADDALSSSEPGSVSATPPDTLARDSASVPAPAVKPPDTLTIGKHQDTLKITPDTAATRYSSAQDTTKTSFAKVKKNQKAPATLSKEELLRRAMQEETKEKKTQKAPATLSKEELLRRAMQEETKEKKTPKAPATLSKEELLRRAMQEETKEKKTPKAQATLSKEELLRRAMQEETKEKKTPKAKPGSAKPAAKKKPASKNELIEKAMREEAEAR
jgi:hypothetical protein